MTDRINDGGPAFPTNGPDHGVYGAGMSMRDYFATKATNEDVLDQGEILREQLRQERGIAILPENWRATARYMHADAMLAAAPAHPATAGDAEDAKRGMADEYQRWIDYYHAGGSYTEFLKLELQAKRASKGGE